MIQDFPWQPDNFRTAVAAPATQPETTFLDGLILTIPDTIHYHRGVKARDMPMDITVEYDGGLISFCGPGKAIELVFEIDELRAIMRLFDVAEAAQP